MSYRSIKTVLGETSLERKCRFLFGASLLVLITASFWWYGRKRGRWFTSRTATPAAFWSRRDLQDALVAVRAEGELAKLR